MRAVIALALASCVVEPPPKLDSAADIDDTPGETGPPDSAPPDSAPPDSAPPDSGQDDTGEPPDDSAGQDDTGEPPVPEPCVVAPALADTDGGGGRVVVEVSDASRVLGVTLGGVSLTDLAVDDATHVSGVPGAHAAGVVDVEVEGLASCPAAFEYWTPAQIDGVDVYLDAAKGIAGDGPVASWTDAGPNGRVFTQDDSARRPERVAAAFGDLPSVRFVPQQLVKLAAAVPLVDGSSIFAVARWTAATDVATFDPNVPLTIVGDATNGYGAFGAKGGQIESNHYVGGPTRADRGEGLNDGVVRLIGATYDTRVETKIYVGNEQQGVDDYTAPLVGQNSYDTVGAGAVAADGWDGELGAVVIVAGVISVGDRTKLDLWAQQRWGTPVSPPLDPWTRTRLGEMPADWYSRDGAQMVQLASGRVLAIGGWSPYDPWGDRTTNEVWASDDLGVTWELLLPHDPDAPKEGEGARFPPGHTVGVTTWAGHAVVIGTDPNQPPYTGEVWVESDEGATWTLVSDTAPTADRCLFMAGSLGDDLYVMGGQANMYLEESAIADVWRSSDGGLTWTELDPPPWAGRGMVYRPVEHAGKLYVVGGGRYDDVDVVAYNGVYAFDGEAWTTVLPDGHEQFEASYYNALASTGDRLWLLNGYTGTEELNRALVSDDDGATWTVLPGGSGGNVSHADAVVATDEVVLRISGNLSERDVHAFSREP
jgi:hypothetical protein